MCDGNRTILDVIEEIQIDDVKTLETLYQLFQKGFFKIKELKNGNYETNSSTKYIAHLKQILKKHRNLISPEHALISIFFQSSGSPDTHPIRIEKPGEAKQVVGAPPVMGFPNRMHLTKSELMMIREKLM